MYYVLSDKVLDVNYKWVDINVDDYRSEIAKLYNGRSLYRVCRLVINRKLRRLRSCLYNIGQMVYHYNIIPIIHKVIIIYNFFFKFDKSLFERLCCVRRNTILCRKLIHILMACYNIAICKNSEL